MTTSLLHSYAILSFREFSNTGFLLIASLLFSFDTLNAGENHFTGNNIAEICDNALDDDLDGLIDLNDPDCNCPVIEPKSLIPNPSFEDRTCCPDQRAQLDCADIWIQASAPTTDYIHTCGWMGPTEYEPPLPLPDGNGVVGFRDGRVGRDGQGDNLNWKEYAGACLLSPLEKNTSYRFEFEVGFLDFSKSPPINVTFFGTTDCTNLPFGGGDETFGCPTNGPNWRKLGSNYLSGGTGNKWIKGAIQVTPTEDIAAIAIGPDCPEKPSMVNLYYYFDNLVLAETKSFEFKISENGHPCSEDFTLEVPDEGDLFYQWYKNGIAIQDEKSPSLSKIYGDGIYQVRIEGSGACKITKPFEYVKPSFTTSVDMMICNGESIQYGPYTLDRSGSYEHTFISSDNCDSTVILDLEILKPLGDTINAKIFEGETFKIGDHQFSNSGEHLASLTSQLGCDSLVTVHLEYYQVYFPNVFSPNQDGRNDHFSIHGNHELIDIKSLIIFDRWGREVYNNIDLYNNDSKGWDGSINGQSALPGVYTYVIRILMDDGKERQFAKSVLVVQ